MGKGLKGNHFHFYEILGLKTASNLLEAGGIWVMGWKKRVIYGRRVKGEPFSQQRDMG